ncbi:MAG: alpha-2,8-polysialyltransferase family protein [Bacteroides sp.]|nr:alpha-2,8-polysialyltransferase family protein [Ruminococcus flavefaciens]MCM1554533.1 alpha-2,8-polysialyltransferase family protein [Bacteroides sp.]
MKHVFFVQSPITYLAMLGVLCNRRIEEKDVVVFSNWKYSQSVVPFVFIEGRSWKDLFRNPSKFLNNARYNDNRLNRLTGGDKFQLYVPAFSGSVDRFAATHRNCAGIHFMEEGLSSYVPELPFYFYNTRHLSLAKTRYVSFKDKVEDMFKVLRGYSFAMHSLPFIYNATFGMQGVSYFGFGEDVFPGFPREKVFRLSFEEIRERFHPECHYDLSGSAVLATCGLLVDLDMFKVDADRYFKAIDDCVRSLAGKKVFLRFHPHESLAVRNKTKELLNAHQLDYAEIGDRSIMEIELLNAKDVEVYGFDSTMQYYAAMFGHKCFSLSNYVYGSSTPGDVLRKVVPFFNQNIG